MMSSNRVFAYSIQKRLKISKTSNQQGYKNNNIQIFIWGNFDFHLYCDKARDKIKTEAHKATNF